MPKTLKRTSSFYPGRLTQGPAKKMRVTRFPRYRGLSAPGVIPKSRVGTMSYSEVITLNGALGGLASYQYMRCNSIHDPNYTGVGHQPYGHDIMAQLYRRYCVLSSSIRCDFISEDPSVGGQYCVGLRLDADPTGSSNPLELLETPGTVYKLLSDADGGPNNTKLYKSFNSKRDFSINSSVQNQGNIGSEFGTNPSHEMFYNIFAFTPSGVDGGNVRVIVTIKYKVLLSEPIDLPLS